MKTSNAKSASTVLNQNAAHVRLLMAICFFCACLFVVGCTGELQRDQEKSAAITSITIKTALMTYKTNTGDWPGSLQELVPLYLEKPETLIDPWGQIFRFHVTGDEKKCFVWTTSPAGKPLGSAPN